MVNIIKTELHRNNYINKITVIINAKMVLLVCQSQKRNGTAFVNLNLGSRAKKASKVVGENYKTGKVTRYY